MRSTRGILLAATLLAATATTAAAAEPEWFKQFGTRANEYGSGAATGPDGRVHVVGSTMGGFLGGAGKGRLDAFVITFDRDGTELWRRQLGTTEDEWASGAAPDADGNVYVVGTTRGALGGTKKGPYSDDDAFVIKFDRDGRTVWKRQPGSTGDDRANAVATDADGNVYVVGYTGGALGGANKGESDTFVIKFDRDGRYLWKRQPGSTDSDYATGVGTDADGNVYVVGETYGALGGTEKGPYYSDAFVIKFDRDGHYLWKRQPGSTDGDSATGVATDADSNVYVVGRTVGALGGANKGEQDAFLIKYDRNGGVLWRAQPGTSNMDFATGVVTGADGNAYVVGSTRGALGGDHQGGSDVFVIKYDRDGGVLRSDQPGTTIRDFGQAVAIDADGNVYVVGETLGSLPGNTSLNGWDAFLIKYGADGPR